MLETLILLAVLAVCFLIHTLTFLSVFHRTSGECSTVFFPDFEKSISCIIQMYSVSGNGMLFN